MCKIKLYKYKSIDYIEDVIINQRLYCSQFDELNDPMEWAFTSNQNKDSISKLIKDTEKDKWRICCLSKSEQYGLMWSMYGDSHHGVCLEVEVSTDSYYIPYSQFDSNQQCYHQWIYGEIIYKNTCAEVNIDQKTIVNVLWTKSKQWEHEQEIRFVSKLTQDETKKYLQVKVNKVFLGRRMTSDIACYINKLCKYADIPCLSMQNSDATQINFWNDYNNKEFIDNQ
ncbi:MAG: DUF2971 domain-containing protein [Bacteroidaceae bacterium]|nr:DUF2971 domain-containing protein [Bacteroidaceae bacterium]